MSGRERERYNASDRKAIGEKIAATLRSNVDEHFERAAFKAGIAPTTYYRWMNTDPVFASIVKHAIHDQAAEAMAAADAEVVRSDGKTAAWHRWKMEKRYRSIYGDLATVQRHELTGADGGPIETAQLSTEQIDARLREIALAAAGEPEASEDE